MPDRLPGFVSSQKSRWSQPPRAWIAAIGILAPPPGPFGIALLDAGTRSCYPGRMFQRIKELFSPAKPDVSHLLPGEAEAIQYFSQFEKPDETVNQLLIELKQFSMLHLDTLTALYQLARASSGSILEVGPYVGGSTIAIAKALHDSWMGRPFLTIEKGGSNPTHPSIPSRDILADLRANLKKYEVQHRVEIVESWSHDPPAMQRITEIARAHPIGLICIDANGSTLGAELEQLTPLCGRQCFLVCDDYVELAPNSAKAGDIKRTIDQLVADARLKPIGVLPWGTWFGYLT